MLRFAAIALCVAGVVGMIATSVTNNNNGALAFGLLTGAGASVLLLVGMLSPTRVGVDQVIAEQLEQEISELVEAGVEERRLRRVVVLARRLGPPSG